MQHPAQPEAGVMKQGSLANFAARLAKQGGFWGELGSELGQLGSQGAELIGKKVLPASPEAVERGLVGAAGLPKGTELGALTQGVPESMRQAVESAINQRRGALIGGGTLLGVPAAAVGTEEGIRRGIKGLGEDKEKTAFGGGFAEGLGVARRAVQEGAGAEGIGGALRAALGQAEFNPHVQKALIAAGILPVGAGTVAATQAIPALKVGGPEIFEKKEKNAEDAINPAQISAPKSTGLPEDQPSKMARPAEVTSQERHVASNEAPAATQPVDVAAVPKKRMAEVLDEPMQTASTDKVLDSVLGSSVVNQAGAKIASAQEARAWLAKVASEGCKCGPEKGTCQFCKVASRLGKGQKGSEKRGQLGTPPVGAGGSSPGGALAGGNITPSM
jgi:hypothetical protein